MLETDISKRDAITLATMIESKLITYKHFIPWADERIRLSDEPLSWILELSLTQDAESAIHHLSAYAYSEPFETFDQQSCCDEFVASKWLLYEINQISWSIFLRECGDYTDAYRARVSCEYFYCMLSEFENSGHSIALSKKQENIVSEYFADAIQDIAKKYKEFLIYSKRHNQTHSVP